MVEWLDWRKLEVENNIIRVFPTKTNMTPVDRNVRFSTPNFFDKPNEVHISVLFIWDIEYAEWLKKQWEVVAPVKIGGPAYNKPGNEFVPGLYVKKSCTITSRGCPNRCWFCSVWKRDPELKELKIYPGNNILDDNLLACSENHIRSVFKMLSTQKQIEFSGGLEAKLLKEWHVQEFTKLKIKQMFFAYDDNEDFESLVEASKILKKAGFDRHKLRCYVLIGYRGDTFEKAEDRLRSVVNIGMFPMAMLYRNERGETSYDWRIFQREWSRPAIIYAKSKDQL